MRIGCVRDKVLWLVLACFAGTAGGHESNRAASIYHVPVAAASSLYELTDPLPLSNARWDPLSEARLELSTGLLPRHEMRFATTSRSGGWVGSDFSLSGMEPGLMFDPLRATYRYTFLERRAWAWKVGITARLGDGDATRAMGADRTRFGGLPLVHLAGEARLARDWLLTFDADGLLTARGRALDIGIRVDYALSRRMFLFGGYKLSDRYVDGDETAIGLSNTANVGVRYRF